MSKRMFLVMFVNVLVTAWFAYTGVDRLEPLILSWFWGPLIAFILADTSVHPPILWLWTHRFAAFWIYLASLLGLTFVFWPFFKHIDKEGLHPFREAISSKLHMPGQTGFFLVFGSFWFVLAVFQFFNVRKHGHRIDNENRDYDSPSYHHHAH